MTTANYPLLVRFRLAGGPARVGVLRGGTVHDVTDAVGSVAEWLRGSAGRVEAAVAELLAAAERAAHTYPAAQFDHPPAPDADHWLAPVDAQDVWAAGVTYERSRAARQEEAADGGDIYARVYAAERPELFFKAQGERVVGPLDAVGIRADAAWSVPEPELTLLLNPALEVVGYTAGNDMSSRDIEGANPLYLPQAKVYNRSCALGPGVALVPLTAWPDAAIRVAIARGGAEVFADSVHTERIHRTLAELVEYLGRSSSYPDGAALLTGTGIVPPSSFALQPGDVVTVTVDGVGALVNTVVTV